MGDSCFENASGRVQGITVGWRPIWANNCFLRGEAEARITLLERRSLSRGRSRGRGARGGGDFTAGNDCAEWVVFS